MQKILIIDDEATMRNALVKLLQRHDFDIDSADSFETAQKNYNFSDYQLILTDLRLPGAAGTRVIEHAKQVPVVIMTAFSSVESAVEAMQMGACNYITKPFELKDLLKIIDKHILPSDSQTQSANTATSSAVNEMVGSSAHMQKLAEQINKIATSGATVLILGESGTGKEVVARAIHQRSPLASKPFITFNCATVPQVSIEKELFGSNSESPGLVKQAAGGTLFLDEIGELPESAQARVLSLLQQDSSRQPIRIIAATHRDLRNLIEQNRFRSDLFYRLRVVELSLPPLRDRGDDIVELANHFLQRYRHRHNKAEMRFSEDALQAIKAYAWPGNVRELANFIEGAVIVADSQIIDAAQLNIDSQMQQEKPLSTIPENLSLEEYFRYFVLEHQQHMTETELARKLGISRKALWERRNRFNLQRPGK